MLQVKPIQVRFVEVRKNINKYIKVKEPWKLNLNCTPKVGHNQQKGCSFYMTKYSKEEKLAAVEAVKAGESQATVARRYGMSQEVVSRNLRMMKAQGEEKLKNYTYNWTAEQRYQVLK